MGNNNHDDFEVGYISSTPSANTIEDSRAYTCRLTLSPCATSLFTGCSGTKGWEAQSWISGNNSAYDKQLPENYAPLLVDNIKKGGYTHIIMGHTAFGKSLMPRVAALLDVQQISDITAIEDEKTFVRPIYAGNAIATVESSDDIKIITIRGTAFAAAEAEGGSASMEDGVDSKAESTTEWVSENLAKSDRPDLATAGKVVSGG